MATTVKMCNMSKAIATTVFKMLNGHDVQLKEHGPMGTVIVTDIEPKDLVYPEGLCQRLFKKQAYQYNRHL